MIRNASGFTLIEALVVLLLMAMVFIAIPPMASWLKQQGSGHAVDTLQANLQLARSMAISRKSPCRVKFNVPSENQYFNTLGGQHYRLSDFRGGIHFMPAGPDGRTMASEITFNFQGMTTSVIPVDIFIAGRAEKHPYRLRILLPGGISVRRWDGRAWR